MDAAAFVPSPSFPAAALLYAEVQGLNDRYDAPALGHHTVSLHAAVVDRGAYNTFPEQQTRVELHNWTIQQHI